MAPIQHAVFPVAGLGTRFLPATKASPKEMLPVVDKPLIQYAVEEAYEAGIRHMIFVTGRNKRAIEDHFDTAYELETELEQAGKAALLDMVRSVQPDDMMCSYVRQPRALGLGHAVLCAEPLRSGNEFADGLDGANCRAAEKVRRLEQWLAEQHIDQATIWAYGDSEGDRELLARADHPLLVKDTTVSPVPAGFSA